MHVHGAPCKVQRCARADMKILLIRLRLIGDVVFTTPIIRALKRAMPDAQLAYLVERESAAVVEGNPHLDEVIVIPRSRGLSRIADDVRLAWRLRRRRFDLVIDMHGGPRSGWLTLATGAPQRIGYENPGRGWMYTSSGRRVRASSGRATPSSTSGTCCKRSRAGSGRRTRPGT